MTIPSNQVNGTFQPGQHLTLGLDFYSLTTSVNITPGAFGTTSQVALDTLVEIISLNGQPVTMAAPYSDGNGHYILKFAIEHNGSWAADSVGPVCPTLVQAIQQNTPTAMGFSTDSALAVTVTSVF